MIKALNLTDQYGLMTPCPVDGCKAFPFGTATELAEHLTSGAHVLTVDYCPTGHAGMEAPRREFGTGTGTGSARPASVEGPTEKQVAYLESLARRAGVDFAEFTAAAEKAGRWNKRGASKMIDDLKARPAAPATPAPVAAGTPAPEFDVVGGKFYRTAAGRIVKAIESKAGRVYGKVLDAETGTFDYEPGATRDIVAELTLEEAQQFGRQTGRCCCCGRELTDPNSIEAGIGPICAAKF